jgi:hypothetical protein
VGDLLLDVQQKQAALQAAIEALTRRVGNPALATETEPHRLLDQDEQKQGGTPAVIETRNNLSSIEDSGKNAVPVSPPSSASDRQGGITSRIILT